MLLSVLSTIALLIVSAGLIYFACELFVNGVEWLGRKLGVNQTAVGTVLAAFGTALPESVVTLVAVVTGHNEASKDIGVGAALGGPLVLSTVAYAVVGLSILANGRRSGSTELTFPHERLSRDQTWFLLIFVIKIALGLIAFTFKPLLGFAFLATYAVYVWTEMRQDDEDEQSDLEPLTFRPKSTDPGLGWVLLQTGLALIVTFAASHLFVEQLGRIGPWVGLSPAVVALLLSPIATELPETMNAIIWIRQGKQRLAVANISGAMMIQATVPSAFGLFFTRWMFDASLILSGAITLISIAGMLVLLHRKQLTALRLSWFWAFYVVFAVGLVFLR
jgi:cation:H+ antiporter